MSTKTQVSHFEMPLRLRVCTFRGLQNLPLLVAMRYGFFAAHGLEVDLSYTPGSAAQIAGLARGEYELIQTAPDNVISATIAPAVFGLDSAPRIVMLAGGSVGPLSIYAHAQFGGLHDLRGATLGVDNPDSGFALVARDMLARSNLALNQGFAFSVAGGTSARLDALRAGTVDATLLYMPYDILAATLGFRRLAISTDYYAAYASLTTAGLGDWVVTHSDEVTHYIAAILQALRWIFDPARATAVQAMLQEEETLSSSERLGGSAPRYLDAASATQAYAAFTAPATGFGSDARLDVAGLDQVIALRAKYGGHAEMLAPAAAYCDLHWYERARAGST